eukprot:1006519-Prymnesium_polylepis.1
MTTPPLPGVAPEAVRGTSADSLGNRGTHGTSLWARASTRRGSLRRALSLLPHARIQRAQRAARDQHDDGERHSFPDPPPDGQMHAAESSRTLPMLASPTFGCVC